MKDDVKLLGLTRVWAIFVDFGYVGEFILGGQTFDPSIM